jgi:hypothetical protein
VGSSFSVPVQTGAGAHPGPYTMGTGFLPAVNWPGRGVDLTLPSSVEVKEKVELYSYFPSATSWLVIG